MSTNCLPVSFLDMDSNSFYFAEENDGLEEDSFRKSNKILNFYIQSTDSKFLILNAEGKFQFENLTSGPQQEHKFNIQIYNSSDLQPRKGRAVMLYAHKNGRKMVACCRGDSEVYAKAIEQELPTELGEAKDEALFYMKELSATNNYVFESTLHQSWFLGFQPDKDNPCRHKLVLIHQKDEVDESTRVLLSQCRV